MFGRLIGSVIEISLISQGQRDMTYYWVFDLRGYLVITQQRLRRNLIAPQERRDDECRRLPRDRANGSKPKRSDRRALIRVLGSILVILPMIAAASLRRKPIRWSVCVAILPRATDAAKAYMTH